MGVKEREQVLRNAYRAGFQEGHYQGTLYDIVSEDDIIDGRFDRWLVGYTNKLIRGEVKE